VSRIQLWWPFLHARWSDDIAARHQTERCCKARQPAGGDCVAHVEAWTEWVALGPGRWVTHHPRPRRPAMMFGLFAAMCLGGIDLGDRRR
jgi:hypothetical protein